MRIGNRFKRKSIGENILHCIVSLFFMVVALSYLYILIWSLMSGTKTHLEIVADPFALPKEWHWEHYVEVFQKLEVNGIKITQSYVINAMLNSLVDFQVGDEVTIKYYDRSSNEIKTISVILKA